MTHNKRQFINFKLSLNGDNKVYLGNDLNLLIYKKERLEILLANSKTLYLSNILYVSDLHKYLFIICDYDLKRRGILIKNHIYHFLVRNNTILAPCLLQDNLYLFDSTKYQLQHVEAHTNTYLKESPLPQLIFQYIIQISIENIPPLNVANPQASIASWYDDHSYRNAATYY